MPRKEFKKRLVNENDQEGPTNSISLIEVREWIDSLEGVGGGGQGPCEDIDAIDFAVEALSGFGLCQKFKITITTPSSGLENYDWRFDIYKKEGLIYTLAESIQVLNGSLISISNKLDEAEYKIKGVLLKKGSNCVVAQLPHSNETIKCEEHTVPPETECFDPTCDPPCICPADGVEEAGAIKIELSSDEVPEGGYFTYTILDDFKDYIEKEEEQKEKLSPDLQTCIFTEVGEIIEFEEDHLEGCIEFQGHTPPISDQPDPGDTIGAPPEGDECFETESEYPLTVEYPINGVLNCISTQGPSTPEDLRLALQTEKLNRQGDGIAIQRENEETIDVQGDALTTPEAESEEKEESPDDPIDVPANCLATEEINYSYKLQDIILTANSTIPGSYGWGASVTITENTQAGEDVVIDNGKEIEIKLDKLANATFLDHNGINLYYTTNKIADLLGNLSKFDVEGSNSASRRNIREVEFNPGSTLETVQVGKSSITIYVVPPPYGPPDPENPNLGDCLEYQGSLSIPCFETEDGEYLIREKTGKCIEKEINGYSLQTETKMLEISTEDGEAIIQQYNPPKFTSPRIDADDDFKTEAFTVTEGTQLIIINIYDSEDNKIEQRFQAVTTKDCYGIQTEEGTPFVGVTTLYSEELNVLKERLTIDCDPKDGWYERSRTASYFTNDGHSVHYCLTTDVDGLELLEIDDKECLEAEDGARNLINYLTDEKYKEAIKDPGEISENLFVSCIEGQGAGVGKYVETELGECLEHDFSDKVMFTEFSQHPIEIQENDITLDPIETENASDGDGTGTGSGDVADPEEDVVSPEGNLVNYCLATDSEGLLFIETEDEECVEVEEGAYNWIHYLEELKNPPPPPTWNPQPYLEIFEGCIETVGPGVSQFLETDGLEEDECLEHESTEHMLIEEDNLYPIDTQEDYITKAPLETELAT